MKSACLVMIPGLLLAACSHQQPRPQAPAHTCNANTQAQSEACRRWIVALPAGMDTHWQMTGRVAIVSGAHSGNARIEWQQQDAQHYQVLLSAPLTRQSWQLSVGGGEAVIRGLPEGARHGTDAAALLHAATGWDIPLRAMPYWLRGRPAPDMAVSQYRFAADGRLLGLMQNGWNIEFSPGAQWPSRIHAIQGENRVRLVVDKWGAAQ